MSPVDNLFSRRVIPTVNEIEKALTDLDREILDLQNAAGILGARCLNYGDDVLHAEASLIEIKSEQRDAIMRRQTLRILARKLRTLDEGASQ